MKKSLRIGIVGAGRNTRSRHIPGLRAIPGVEISAVCNRTRESSERAARELGIPRVYPTWEELVRAEEVDAVVIGTWPYMHCPITVAAIEAGKHVLCEARMAMNGAEARRMLAASRARPLVVCQIVPSPMTLEVDRTVTRLLREGILGELFACEVRAQSGAFPDRSAPLSWRQNEEYSGNNIMSLGIWYEALMRWIGPSVGVQALGKTVVGERHDAEQGGVTRSTGIPDHLYVQGVMASGAVASMTVSTVSGGAPEESISLFGESATLVYRGGRLELRRRGHETPEIVAIPPEERVGWRVEEDFIRSVTEGAPVERTSFEDGVRYMEFTDAVKMSMDEERRVSLEETR